MEQETETAAAEPQSADLKDGTPGIDEIADVLGLTAPEAATEENSVQTEEITDTQPVEPQPEPEPEQAPEPPQEDRTQARIDQRIGKEVAKRKELEEQVESERAANRDLGRRLEEAEAGSRKEALSIDDPVTKMTPADLDKMEQEQRDMKKWAVSNWDGYASENEEGEDFDAEQVRALYNSSVDNLEVKIPAARQKILLGNELQSRAVGKYPFLVDKNAPEFPHAAYFYNTEAFRAAYHADPKEALEQLGQAALARAHISERRSAQTDPTPPTIPTDVAPAGPSAVADAKPRNEGLPIKEFVKAGGSHDALVNLIQQTI